DADEVDHRVPALRKRFEHPLAHDVGLDHVDRGQGQKMLGPLAVPRGYGDAQAAPGQCRHEVPADEAATPQDEDVVELYRCLTAAVRLPRSAPRPRARARFRGAP